MSVRSSFSDDASVASLDAPLLGLSVTAFERVIADAGGREALAGRTTEWLKHSFVKLATACEACTIAALLQRCEDRAALVGHATAFLSHTYDGKFLDAVDAAAQWEAEHLAGAGAAHFFYFDLLS